MAPRSWKPCPHCGQQFSERSLQQHGQRCSSRAEVAAEHELRELEGFRRPEPMLDWPQCPNCGEQYGSTAIGPHTKRCRRLRPQGANGWGAGGESGGAGGAAVFGGLWGVGDLEAFIGELRTAAGIAEDSDQDAVRGFFRKCDVDGNGRISEDELRGVIRSLCPHFTAEQIHGLFEAADWNKDSAVDYAEFLRFVWSGTGPKGGAVSKADMEALRAVFNRFDEDFNGLLSPGEFANLMRNMLPTRSGVFDAADIDSSGAIDFEEFLRYWTSIAGSPGFEAGLFDEAADMFHCFASQGELDRHGLLAVLNNTFPTHCEENEEAVDAEFAAADVDGSSGISFPEFLAYYGRLRRHYGGKGSGWPPHDADERAASLNEGFVPSPCGLPFLPDRLAVHLRNCPECKAAAAAQLAARRTTEAEAARRRRAEEEERSRKATEEAAELMEEARRAAEEAAARRAEQEHSKKQQEQQQQQQQQQQLQQQEERAAAEEAVLRKAKDAERARRAAEEAARRAAEARALAEQQAEQVKAGADDGHSEFMPCDYCGRTFFPDRLQVHLRSCQKKKLMEGGQLCRETMTPGETCPTRGRYAVPQ
ncbi:unnamed protein product [Polarella glacialis]|uniref:Calmodulin n=1 Tax=Polarella glacialis TaxID=89957 RepID=A0A813GP73_POLGL|nr:unnamed protein product [Polarella glacialis]